MSTSLSIEEAVASTTPYLEPYKIVRFENSEIRFFNCNGVISVPLVDLARACSLSSGTYIVNKIPFPINIRYISVKVRNRNRAVLSVITEEEAIQCVKHIAENFANGSLVSPARVKDAFLRLWNFVGSGWVSPDTPEKHEVSLPQVSLVGILDLLKETLVNVDESKTKSYSKEGVMELIQNNISLLETAIGIRK